MINESAANQAEIESVKQQSAIIAKYKSLEGLAANAAAPQFGEDMQAVNAGIRSNLPAGAQRMFDANTAKRTAYSISEYQGYAASELKKFTLKSNDAIGDTGVASAGDINTVTDPEKFNTLVKAPIIHSGNSIAELNGTSTAATGVNNDTGNFSYPDTPEGKQAEALHLQYTNTKLAQAYTTGVKTVADNQGAAAASDWAQKHWNDMPDMAKVQINQFLAPKVKNEFISGNVNSMTAQLTNGYSQQLTANVPTDPVAAPAPTKTPLDVIKENEGEGYKNDSKGEVINGINSLAYPKEFSEAKKIFDTEGQAAATKYTDAFYQKNIIDKYGISSLPANTQNIVADGLVNHGTGDFGQSLIQAAKDGASPQQLIDMRRAEYQRLNATGKPEYTSNFEGWNNRLDSFASAAKWPAAGLH